MILLILPLIWAAVLLPPWIIHRREGRVARSVVAQPERFSAVQRPGSVARYVFGAYDPYREAPDGRRAEADHDRSYPPLGYHDDVYLSDHDYYHYDEALVDQRVDRVEGPDLRYEDEPYSPATLITARAGNEVDADRSVMAEGAPVHRFPSPVYRSAAYGRAGGRPSARPVGAEGTSSRAALARRRAIFMALFAGFAGTLASVVAVQSLLTWAAHGTATAMFLGYLVLLVQHHQRLVERSAKVRDLDAEDAWNASGRPLTVYEAGVAR